MRDHKHLLNLNKLKPPKIKPDIESLQQSQNNTTFVMTNEKGLYSSQNFVIKAISIVSNMADSALASDDDKGGFLDHVNLVKSHTPQYNCLFKPCFGRTFQKKKK